LPKISVPLLEISPYNAPDFAAAAARSGQPLISEQQKTDYYRQLLAGTPHLTVTSISPSRHFVMLDQPQRFLQVVDDFLSALDERP
jgi:pimeloyl-ACP methyl ester carboxylesterase